MSSKKILDPFLAIVAQSMAGNIVSPTTSIKNLDNVGVQFIWTGTPTGTFFVQVSADGVTFDAITLPATVSASGSAGHACVDLNQISFPFIQVGYTAASGSGSLTAYITAKGLQG